MIKSNLLKNIGRIGLVILTFVMAVLVTLVLIIGIILFVILSIFKFTSSLAPVSLLVCGFLSLIFIAQAEGFIDYFSTQFFEGVSLDVILKLPVPVLITVLSIVLTFIISSVSMYLPQVEKN